VNLHITIKKVLGIVRDHIDQEYIVAVAVAVVVDVPTAHVVKKKKRVVVDVYLVIILFQE
jgi:hypothetical protein